MKLPSPETVSRLLSGLIGEDQRLDLADDLPAIADLGAGWGKLCRDEEGRPVGAVLVDLVATVSLGGRLMMLPHGGLEAQVARGRAEGLVIEATDELLDRLAAAVNQLGGNARLQPGAARPVAALMAEPGGDWLADAAVRGDYAGEFACGRGRVVLLGR